MVDSDRVAAGETDDEIDLRELVATLWAGRWLIVAVTGAFAVGAVIVALLLPDRYRAEALVIPQGRESGLGALASQFGGLASLAGVDLSGAQGDDGATVAFELVQSRKFLIDFVNRHDLIPAILAVEDWDRESDQLVFDPEQYDPEARQWVRAPAPPRGVVPTALEAQEALSSEILEISEDPQSGLVTVAVTHASPSVASDWVSWLIADLNDEMRRTQVDEATRSIAFLNQQLEATPLTDLQQVFYELIEEQTKKVMLANVREEFVWKTIDPAITPELRSEPNRALIAVVGTLLGGVLAAFIVLVRSAMRPTPGRPENDTAAVRAE